MNKSPTSLQAFTLMEMMVALVLTAITLSLVYTAVRFVQQQSSSLKNHLDGFWEFNRLHQALQTDAQFTQRITVGKDGTTFHRRDATVHYVVADTVFIRINGLSEDIFRVKVDSIGHWLGNERQETEGRLADRACLYATVHGVAIPLEIVKRYDASTLITYSPTAHE